MYVCMNVCVYVTYIMYVFIYVYMHAGVSALNLIYHS